MKIIDADALCDDIIERYCKDCEKRKGIKRGKWRVIYEIGEAPCRACDVDDLKMELDEAPTIEAEPVRHGKWISHGSYFTCSVCGEEQYGIDTGRYYCQNCGAKMIPTIPKEIIDAVLGEDEVEDETKTD